MAGWINVLLSKVKPVDSAFLRTHMHLHTQTTCSIHTQRHHTHTHTNLYATPHFFRGAGKNSEFIWALRELQGFKQLNKVHDFIRFAQSDSQLLTDKDWYSLTERVIIVKIVKSPDSQWNGVFKMSEASEEEQRIGKNIHVESWIIRSPTLTYFPLDMRQKLYFPHPPSLLPSIPASLLSFPPFQHHLCATTNTLQNRLSISKNKT